MSIKTEIVEVCRELYDRGLVQTTAGNVSVKKKDSKDIFITCTGSCFEDITENEIILIDSEGEKIKGGKEPSCETPFHTAILNSRPELKSIVHTHAPAVKKLGAIGRTLVPTDVDYLLYPEILKGIPLVPFYMPGTEQLKQSVKIVFDDGYDIAFLQGHGAVVASKTLDRAFNLMLALEDLAKEQVEILKIGKPVSIPHKNIEQKIKEFK